MGVFNLSSRLATAGLVGLVALDVVLIGAALRSTSEGGIQPSPVNSAGASMGATVPVSPSSTPSVSPSAVTAATTAVTTPAVPLQVMLEAIDDRHAWRVTAGSCAAGGATLARTSDGGKTWVDVKAPLRSIVRVRAVDGTSAFVVGAGPRCLAELKSTTNGGETWGATSTVGSAWFRDPKNPTVVQAPGSSTSKPCGKSDVLDLAVVSSTTARVLCADGLVRSTTDTGSSWADSGKVAGAVALAVLSASPAQTYVARLDVPDCAGIQVQRVDGSGATSCIETAVPNDPGQIALSLVKGGGWLAIGDTTMRSTDSLATWSVS